MSGITRIAITDKMTGPGGDRPVKSQKRWLIANKLYREIFDRLGTPLAPGYTEIRCTIKEFEAGYDHKLGIDIMLELDNGFQVTMQEKFLYTHYNTVTVEYYNDPARGITGDWFDMKCQYYFVGYDYPNTPIGFETWVLLNWPQVQLVTTQGRIQWRHGQNRRDGARASFKHTPIVRLPPDVVVASSYYGTPIDKLPQPVV